MQAPRTHQEQCQHCRHLFALCGLKRHEAACKQKLDERQADTRYEQQLQFQIGSVETIITVPSPGEDISVGQPPINLNDLDPESLTKKNMKTMFQLLKPEARSNQDNTEFNICSPKEFKEHWDLAVNMITPPYFVWDAIQLSKWNGQVFERFIDKPWTAQAFWDLQIKENAKLKGKVYYVDFKRRVWHAAFGYILEPLFVPSKLGSWVHLNLADEDLQLFPRVPIKSCDYEEVLVISLVLLPCKLTKYHVNRNFVVLTRGNAFWNIEDCDPFRVLSFDCLHAYNNGLFGDHIRMEVISQVEALGSESVGWADDQIKCFPCWRNLSHFESGFMAVHFSDGTKYKDLSKHIIFVTHNILTETKDVHGYHLLKCVRSYMELRMYAGFNLHAECSIQAIWDKLVKFSELIREYKQLTKSVKQGAKQWNFPKVHSHKHMVDDILKKGVTLNYNTKPNENMHGPLKDTYQL
ncbi:hypothetical protein IW261DRAFT_1429700 [Armillaria novae-zelandiae]|uniref:Uncharacterized protein n=1 Tax=Armillaria novae-zelandiae TaxID=153914 RepID=A0AA39KE63_9AGAR|nr:hypothetical protein IW261DRAFT_1429700 [Armillaria novae-zelandiae]